MISVVSLVPSLTLAQTKNGAQATPPAPPASEAQMVEKVFGQPNEEELNASARPDGRDHPLGRAIGAIVLASETTIYGMDLPAGTRLTIKEGVYRTAEINGVEYSLDLSTKDEPPLVLENGMVKKGMLAKDTKIDGLPLKAGTRIERQNGDLIVRDIPYDLKAGPFTFKKGTSICYHHGTVQLIGPRTINGSYEIKLGGDLKVGPYLFLAGSIINLASNWELMLTYEAHYRAVYHGLKVVRINPWDPHPNGMPQGVTADKGNVFHNVEIMPGSILGLFDDGSIGSIVTPGPQTAKFGAYTYDLTKTAFFFQKSGKPRGGVLAFRQKVDGKWQDAGTSIRLDERTGKLKEAWRQR